MCVRVVRMATAHCPLITAHVSADEHRRWCCLAGRMVVLHLATCCLVIRIFPCRVFTHGACPRICLRKRAVVALLLLRQVPLSSQLARAPSPMLLV